MNAFFARGKLLLSAEYMVMHGSSALAVPLHPGQSLERVPSKNPDTFTWTACEREKEWFNATLHSGTLRIIRTSDDGKADFLRRILQACIEMMPSFQEELFRWDVVTRMEFSPDWGFGSSSTLIALLAEWAEVNPLDLHFMVSEGSGYDVASALASGPILYKLRDHGPYYRHVPFNPSFHHHIYFAWLGSKQSTASHLRKRSNASPPDFGTIHRFSQITEAMIAAEDLETFSLLMLEHEDVLSEYLGMEKISRTKFAGLTGAVKSLGAWGGDFVMIASEIGEGELFDYLHDREISVVFRYADIVYYGSEV